MIRLSLYLVTILFWWTMFGSEIPKIMKKEEKRTERYFSRSVPICFTDPISRLNWKKRRKERKIVITIIEYRGNNRIWDEWIGGGRWIDHDRPIDRSRSLGIIILEKRRRPFDIWQEFVDMFHNGRWFTDRSRRASTLYRNRIGNVLVN